MKHLPLVKNSHGQKLSKRENHFHFTHLQKNFLPQAVKNYLSTKVKTSFLFEEQSLISYNKRLLMQMDNKEIFNLTGKDFSQEIWHVAKENVALIQDISYWHEVFYEDVLYAKEKMSFHNFSEDYNHWLKNSYAFK